MDREENAIPIFRSPNSSRRKCSGSTLADQLSAISKEENEQSDKSKWKSFDFMRSWKKRSFSRRRSLITDNSTTRSNGFSIFRNPFGSLFKSKRNDATSPEDINSMDKKNDSDHFFGGEEPHGAQGGWKDRIGYGPANLYTGGTIVNISAAKASTTKAQVSPSETKDVEIRANWKSKVDSFMDNSFMTLLALLLTVYALFWPDISLIAFDSTVDIYTSITSIVVMALFVIELFLLSLCRGKYFLSLFFCLDLIAALSMLSDIHWITNSSTVADMTVARYGKASRAARAGSRAGRIIKLTRLVRVAKLFSWQDRRSSSKEKGNVGHAGDIARKIANMTTQKVIVIILIMVFVMPLLEQEIVDSGAFVLLNTMVRFKAKNMSAQVNHTAHIFLSHYPETMSLEVGNITYVQKNVPNLRLNEILMLSESDGYVHAQARLNVRSNSAASSTTSILTTAVVIVLLTSGAYLFSVDSTRLANKMALPLADLCEDMEAVAGMEFDRGIEHVLGDVYEIRQIQMSFIKMKRGMSSFSKYVPRDVVSLLMKTNQEAMLGVEPKQLTILFSDIAHFTCICEQTAPSDLLLLLSDYFEEMSRLINQSGGTLGEFIGDAILAFCTYYKPHSHRFRFLFSYLYILSFFLFHSLS